MPNENRALIDRVIALTPLGPGAVARELGVSIRTLQRWRIGEGSPLPGHLRTFAELVADKDPKLATHLYDRIDAFHWTHGIPLPQRPDRNEVRNEPGARLAEQALLVASAMLGVAPDKLRPALRTALLTAKKGGATLEAFIKGLERSAPG